MQVSKQSGTSIKMLGPDSVFSEVYMALPDEPAYERVTDGLLRPTLPIISARIGAEVLALAPYSSEASIAEREARQPSVPASLAREERAPAARVETARAAVEDSFASVTIADPVTSPISTPTAPLPLSLSEARAKRAEASRQKFNVRAATREDIPAMVEIDLAAFRKVYEGQRDAPDVDAKRAELTSKFEHRYELVGPTWMPVLTQSVNGQETLVGFVHCCPTKKDPSTFQSWEETTDNGMLDTLYDPDGKNIYVVTLSMDPSVSGKHGHDQIILQQVGIFIANGMDTAFFESRMPGLRKWMQRKINSRDMTVDELSEAEQLQYAKEYFELQRTKPLKPTLTSRVLQLVGIHTEQRTKKVPFDPLLAEYEASGFTLGRVVPNAYQDKPSMNFGVLCTFENPLKGRPGILSRAVGGVMKAAAKSSWITRKLF